MFGLSLDGACHILADCDRPCRDFDGVDAKEHQPVASLLGLRLYDWQLAQNAEESWRECHLHARNLLGEDGCKKLLADIKAEKNDEPTLRATEPDPSEYGQPDPQKSLFD